MMTPPDLECEELLTKIKSRSMPVRKESTNSSIVQHDRPNAEEKVRLLESAKSSQNYCKLQPPPSTVPKLSVASRLLYRAGKQRSGGEKKELPGQGEIGVEGGARLVTPVLAGGEQMALRLRRRLMVSKRGQTGEERI